MPVTSAQLTAAVDHYADTVTQRFAEAVIAGLAALKEPPRPPRRDREPRSAARDRIDDTGRALYVAGLLAETLGGFAVGGAASELIEAVRAANTDANGERASQRRRISEVAIDTDSQAGERTRPKAVLADAEARPLVDELGVKLLPAVLCARSTIHRVARAIVSAVEPARAVEVLASPAVIEAAALRFADQIEYGWQTYLAALSGAKCPAIVHERSRELWKTWLRRVRHERRETVERDPRDLGYVLRVA